MFVNHIILIYIYIYIHIYIYIYTSIASNYSALYWDPSFGALGFKMKK